MTESEEMRIAPCPFCGGEAYQSQYGNEYTRKAGFDVGCKKCRVKIVDRTLHQYISLEKLKNVNAQNWNTRTPAPSLEESWEEFIAKSRQLASIPAASLWMISEDDLRSYVKALPLPLDWEAWIREHTNVEPDPYNNSTYEVVPLDSLRARLASLSQHTAAALALPDNGPSTDVTRQEPVRAAALVPASVPVEKLKYLFERYPAYMLEDQIRTLIREAEEA